MGPRFKNIVPLDDYPRIGRDGTVTHPLAGYEFVVRSKGPLHSRVPGESACVGMIRKSAYIGMSVYKFLQLYPKAYGAGGKYVPGMTSPT